MSKQYDGDEFDDLLHDVISSEHYIDPLMSDPACPDPFLSGEELQALEKLEEHPVMELLAHLWCNNRIIDREVDRQYEFAILDCQGFLSSLAGDVRRSEGNITSCNFAIRKTEGKYYFAGTMQVTVPESHVEGMDRTIKDLQDKYGHDESVFDELDRILGIRGLALQGTPVDQHLKSSEPSDVCYHLFTIDREGILEKLLLEIWEEGTITHCSFAVICPAGGIPYFTGVVGVKICDGSRSRLDERLASRRDREKWESLEPLAA